MMLTKSWLIRRTLLIGPNNETNKMEAYLSTKTIIPDRDAVDATGAVQMRMRMQMQMDADLETAVATATPLV
jgi:hypothetical protein